MDDRNIKKIETEKLYKAKLTIKNQSYIVYLTEQNIKQNEVIPELNIYGIIECHRPIRHFCLTKNTNISQCTVITKDMADALDYDYACFSAGELHERKRRRL